MNRFAGEQPYFDQGIEARHRRYHLPEPHFYVPDEIDDGALRRLAAATIWKAVEDAIGDDGQFAYSAIRWLANDTTDGLTLDRCCQLLDLAPDRVQTSLSDRFETIKIRLDQYRKVRVMTHRIAVD